MRRCEWLWLFVLAWLFLLSLPAGAAEVGLDLQAGGKLRHLSLKEMQATLPSRSLAVVNPDLNRRVDYLVFPLAEVLKLGQMPAGEELIFHCQDGYAAPAPYTAVKDLDLYLAFGEDGKAGKWTPIPVGKLVNDPAPFIVISGNSSDAKVFSWPYQVVRIESVDFAQKYARILPKGAPKGGAVARGFEVFRHQCLKCHSINLQGGEIGPELNVPQNITEYRGKAFLQQWIADPASFRARARMPSLGLSKGQIDDVIAYLAYMKGLKASP